jgi:hypothetical protein
LDQSQTTLDTDKPTGDNHEIHDADDSRCLPRWQTGTRLYAGSEEDGTVGRFNEELGKALTIESLNGLHPLAKGARVSFANGKPSVTDGPFIEPKDVMGGYWLVEAPSKEEVVKWAQRCPADQGDTIEIRQIFGPEDFAK